jgi:signal peptidase I
MDPWQAALWSLLCPGVGQILQGEIASGWSYLILFFVSGGIVFAAFAFAAIPIELAPFALAAVLFLGIASIVVAHHHAARIHREPRPPSPWKAAFFTRLLPGLGQLIERRIGPGVLFLVLVMAASSIQIRWISELLVGAIGIFALLDAASRSTHGGVSREELRPLLVVAVVVSLVGAVVPPRFRATLIQAFRIPAESMVPTFEVGDCVIVDRTRAGRANPGELLVFDYPSNRKMQFIKRCVATQGESVEIRDKQLLVDGRPIIEPYAIHADSTVRPASFDFRDNFGPVRVPPGCAFMLGDNRDNSNDSRYFGAVPMNLVLGRVIKIYWPPNRWHSLRTGPG